MSDRATDINRAMPFSDDAEKGLLSCFLQNPELLGDAQTTISADAFYHFANRRLYEELLAMQAGDVPVDLVTVSNHLIDKGLMDKIGGPSFIAELLSFVPTSAHYPYYKGIVTDKLRVRMAIQFCTEGIQRAYEYQADEISKLSGWLLESAMRLHESAVPSTGRQGRMFKEIGHAVIDEASEPRSRGMTTGFPWLDSKTGGLQPGRVFVISGGTGDGKSALALQMGLAATNAGHPGDVHSLEMPDTEVWQRAACQEQSIPSKIWQSGLLNRYEVSKIGEFMKRVYPVRVFDDLFDIDQICASLRVERARRGIRWAIIDYLQLCDGDSKDGREREVSTIAKKIKQVAQSLQICIITLSQLNDDGRLRESRAIGQHADHVVRIAIDEKNDALRTLHIDKNRGGPRRVKCLYSFVGENFQFIEREEKPQ